MGGWTVGGEADRDTCFEHLAHRKGAGAQLCVAHRAGGDAGTPFGQDLDVAGIELRAVRACDVRAEETE